MPWWGDSNVLTVFSVDFRGLRIDRGSCLHSKYELFLHRWTGSSTKCYNLNENLNYLAFFLHICCIFGENLWKMWTKTSQINLISVMFGNNVVFVSPASPDIELFMRVFQVAAQAVLFMCMNTAGIFISYLSDRAQRQAFLETRRCIEARLRLETENQRQVSRSRGDEAAGGARCFGSRCCYFLWRSLPSIDSFIIA